jgi:hypothetical protein
MQKAAEGVNRRKVAHSDNINFNQSDALIEYIGGGPKGEGIRNTDVTSNTSSTKIINAGSMRKSL